MPVRNNWLLRLTLIGAVVLYVLVFEVLPYFNILQYSFWTKELYSVSPDLNLENYRHAFQNSLYRRVLLNSLEVAATVTSVTLVLGYLLAYHLAFLAGRYRNLLYFLLIVPLLTSFLLRAYIWKIILGRSGILNSALMSLNLIDQPISVFLYNQFSIVIALVYIFLPFVALPVYDALERLPRNLSEASDDLGANPLQTFLSVVLPLSMPGVIAGGTIVFCLSVGDFIAPQLLGGTESLMIANVIVSQFGAAFNWPFGAALAVITLIIVLIIISLSYRFDRAPAS